VLVVLLAAPPLAWPLPPLVALPPPLVLRLLLLAVLRQHLVPHLVAAPLAVPLLLVVRPLWLPSVPRLLVAKPPWLLSVPRLRLLVACKYTNILNTLFI
jgi:hypothetical protein